MAYFQSPIRYKIEPDEIIRPGLGINTYDTPFQIARGESISMLNMTNRYYPAISVRQGRAYGFASSSNPISKVNGAGAYNDSYLMTMDYVYWKYYTSSTNAVTLSSSMPNLSGSFLEFSNETNRYSIFVNSSSPLYWTGNTSEAVASSTAMPRTKLYTATDKKLFALSGSVLYCSADGSITDWSSVYDADTIAVNTMLGSGTAITWYNDTIICWGDQTMHVLYGAEPAEFEFANAIQNGCIGYKANIIHDGVLYFMDYYKILAYTGGIPTDISQKVRTYLENVNYTYKENIVMGSIQDYIYISIPYGDSVVNNITLEYDTKRQAWYVWNVGFVEFLKLGEYTYAVDKNGYVWKLNSGTDDGGKAISWSIDFGVLNSIPALPKKAISSIVAIVDLPTNSTMTAYYSSTVDGDDWVSFYTFTASADEQNTKMTIPTSALQNVNWYRIKLAGTGPCTIHYLEPYLRVKAR